MGRIDYEDRRRNVLAESDRGLAIIEAMSVSKAGESKIGILRGLGGVKDFVARASLIEGASTHSRSSKKRIASSQKTTSAFPWS
ncbi:MAG TPA: hypothetical protein VE262_11570 [Blastocatellia bacterium]|nr:hypothetical protein [Blastocatellia bacterium]